MFSRRPAFVALAIVFAVGLRGARAQETSPTKISVEAFGDYYWVAQHDDEEIEDRNGFWFRRIYLTFDQRLSESISARLRFEASQPGDFASAATLDPIVKDAWVRWSPGPALQVVAGIAPTPAFSSLEEFWGYRAVEKTPLDLQRMADSRDFGIALQGRVGSGERIRYHAMFGNGSGTGTETDQGKKIALLAGADPFPGATVEVYADRDDRPGETDRVTAQIFAGWRRDTHRIGVMYARQNRELGDGTEIDLDIASAFAVLTLRPRLAALLRVDRMFDPNPEADRIPYLRLDPSASSTLVIAGVDIGVHEHLSLIPNIEWVTYDGEAVDDGLFPRITFHFRY